jgi:RNA polymerase sigma-70 factor (ECF subfamily)
MAQKFNLASLSDITARLGALIELLHGQANCARWGLDRMAFAEGLRRSAEKRFRGAGASTAEVETYLKSLHLEDLALAYACAEGLEPAWDFFVEHFRQDLRGAARAILRASGTGDPARAEELADSIYAELYGVSPTGGARRKSLFEYFHGRSKLSTWLRAIIAQRHVDLLRTNWRAVPLETEDEGEGALREPVRLADARHPQPDRERYLALVDQALSAALSGLAPRERMILACYYVDQSTLAEIGRELGEHESTVSRQLDRIRRTLRENVTESLQRGRAAPNSNGALAGLDQAQVDLAFEYALEDWPFDLSRALSKGEKARDTPKK